MDLTIFDIWDIFGCLGQSFWVVKIWTCSHIVQTRIHRTEHTWLPQSMFFVESTVHGFHGLPGVYIFFVGMPEHDSGNQTTYGSDMDTSQHIISVHFTKLIPLDPHACCGVLHGSSHCHWVAGLRQGIPMLQSGSELWGCFLWQPAAGSAGCSPGYLDIYHEQLS